jgi:hypothetical protein
MPCGEEGQMRQSVCAALFGACVIFLPSCSETPLRSYRYLWDDKDTKKEISDDKGIAGQGNPNPNSFFKNHVVARLHLDGDLEAVLFDPSYGKIWQNLTALDDNLVDFYAHFIAEPDEVNRDLYARPNPTGLLAAADLKRDTTQGSTYR